MKSARSGLPFLSAFLVILISTSLVSQYGGVTAAYADTITWAKTYGGSEHDEAEYVESTSDGGYIVAGVMDRFDVDASSVWVLKLDSDGNVEWEKTYGGNKFEEALEVHETSDGGYVVAARTEQSPVIVSAAWVLKLNSEGDIEWENEYPAAHGALSVQQSSDGGYVLAGFENFSVLKLNSEGIVEWHKEYGESTTDHSQSVRQTSDGGYVATGGTTMGAAKVLKLESDGNVEWEKAYGGGISNQGVSIQQTTDGGYIVAGDALLFDEQPHDIWFLKLDSDGNVEWEKAYGGSGSDRVESVQQTLDGGYVIVGHSDSFGLSSGDIWFLKLNSEGGVEWEKAYGGQGPDEATSVAQTSDDGYIVAGETESFGSGLFADAWVLKLDSEGEIENCGVDFIQDTDATITDGSSTTTDTSQDVVDVESSHKETAAIVDNSSSTVRSQCGDYQFLILEDENVPSDGIVDWGQEIAALATTFDESVDSVTIRWINSTGDTVRDVTLPISTTAQDHFSPKEGGQWTVEADFLNGIVIRKMINVSFFVIPESPIGTIAMVLSSIGALGGYLYFRSRNPRISS